MLKKIVLGTLIGTGLVFPTYLRASDPIANMPITVTKGEKIYSATTGDNGKFIITKLPLGKYTVSMPIGLEIISIDLSVNGKSYISLSSRIVDTYIALIRNKRTLSGEITEDIIPDPTPTITPLPLSSPRLTPPTQPSLLPSLFNAIAITNTIPVPTLNQ